MAEFQQKVSEFDRENVYNADESGLSYSALPSCTFFLPKNIIWNIRGTSFMHLKSKLTIIVCTNSDRTHNLPMFLSVNRRIRSAFSINCRARSSTSNNQAHGWIQICFKNGSSAGTSPCILDLECCVFYCCIPFMDMSAFRTCQA